LVTPARDEAATIGRTIAAVTRQTVTPSEWIIVSDGSTDATDDIVRDAGTRHPWIRLLALPPRTGRSFAAVVHNTELGIRSLNTVSYRFLGLLDSDLDFAPTYFEEVLTRFAASPRLGMAGGVVIDVGRPKHVLPKNRLEIPGAVQFFRRECFESLGGLVAIPEGGWDCLTSVMARMNGYETRLLTDLVVDHLKPRNISQGGSIRRVWQLGERDYAIGYDPLFELVKCVSRVMEPPAIVSAIARWFGFCAAAVARRPRVVPPDVVAFLREEQRKRLTRIPGRVSAPSPATR
jgi:glycosyltransferase involved in cell wall biosynthesis